MKILKRITFVCRELPLLSEETAHKSVTSTLGKTQRNDNIK